MRPSTFEAIPNTGILLRFREVASRDLDSFHT